MNPDADEDPANGIDDDCDGETDEGDDGDADDDGYTADGGDCDDEDGWTYPGAYEFCDGIDNDCDGQYDEDCVGEDTGSLDPNKPGGGNGTCATAPGGRALGLLWALAGLAGLTGLIRRRR
ncbi:MAG: MopE-related protein [Pseudomonadota bacterium]